MADIEKIGLIKLQIQDGSALKVIAELNKAIADLTNKKDNLNTKTVAGQLSDAKYAEQIKALKTEVRSYSKEIQNSIKIQNQKTASLDAMATSISAMTQRYNAMSATERNAAKGTELAAKINTTTAALRTEETALGNHHRAVGDYAVAGKAVVLSLDEQAAKAGELQNAFNKLKMEQELAAQTALNLGAKYGVNDANFIAAANHSKKLAAELGNLEKATGRYATKAFNSNYATFQMTQVMRELPNFVIDARIGFMSLSNNLPMLTQSFQDMAKSVDAVTGKAVGSLGALKMMAKSLLSLNTIMVVASTLMIMYGDKLVTWVNTLFKGEQAAGSVGKQIEILNGLLKKGASSANSAASATLELGIILEKAVGGTYNADAAVMKYNNTLGVHYGKVNNVTDAMAGYLLHSNDYIKSMLAQAAAMQVLDAAASSLIEREIVDKQLNQIDNIAELNSKYLETVAVAKKVKGGMAELLLFLKKPMTEGFGDVRLGSEALQKSFQNLYRADNSTEFVKLMAKRSDALSNLAKAQKTAKTFMDEMSLASTVDLKTKTPGAGSTPTAVDIEAVNKYNTVLGQLKVTQDKLAEQASNTEVAGIAMSYELRTQSAKTWLDNQKLILAEDKRLQDSDLQATMDKVAAQKVVLASLTGTTKAENAKRITLQNQIAKEEKQIQDSQLQSTNEFNSGVYEAEKQNRDWLYQIGQDKLKDRKAELLQQQGDQLKANELLRSTEIEAAEAKYQIDLKSTRNDRERKKVKLSYQTEINRSNAYYDSLELQEREKTLKALLELDTTSEEDKGTYRKELHDLEVQAEIDKNNKLIQANRDKNAALEESERQSQDNRKAILSEALNTASDLISQYSEYAKDQSDQVKNKQLADLEEKKDRGLVTDTEYEKQKTKIEKAAFEREKKLKVKQAWMEYALGLVKIWAANATPVLWPVGLAMSAFLTATTAANVATISSQKYAKRGMLVDELKDGTLLQGPSHAGGGININAEGGEAIINRKSTTMFAPLLSAINEAGGGVKFAAGGIPSLSLSNDGGYSARALQNMMSPGLTESQIKTIVSSIRIYTTVTDIRKADKDYTNIENSGSF